jgi:hypothetical protein
VLCLLWTVIFFQFSQISIDIDDINETIEIEPEDPCIKYAVSCEDGSQAAMAILGRQKVTEIKWIGISRALCDVSLVERSASSSTVFASMHMRRPPNTDGQYNSHHVYLDGDLVNVSLGVEIPLKNGSIIALYGPTGFAYQVCICQNIENANATANETTNITSNSSPKRQKINTAEAGMSDNEHHVPTERERIRQRAYKVMEDEFKCALCTDILVKSTFAFPCSHAFCKDCSELYATTNKKSTSSCNKVGTCPTCMGDVLSWMSARSYDSQVWSFALQGCFERSDAEEYLRRREQAGDDAPTEEERGSILNTSEGGENDNDVTISRSSLLINKQPETNHVVKTLPPMNSTDMISNANNGLMNVKMAAYNPSPQYRLTNDGTICID